MWLRCAGGADADLGFQAAVAGNIPTAEPTYDLRSVVLAIDLEGGEAGVNSGGLLGLEVEEVTAAV